MNKQKKTTKGQYKPPVSPEVRAAIRAERSNGAKVSEIAHMFDLSVQSVYDILKDKWHGNREAW